jgi:hypothetical protein
LSSFKVHTDKNKFLLGKEVSRIDFFRGLSGSFLGLVLASSGCKPSNFIGGSGSTAAGLSFGSGDIGLLNYLYVVEQVQYNFYLNLIRSGTFSGINNTNSLLSDITLHQLTHTQFYKSALGTNAIESLDLDFSSIDFTQAIPLLSIAEKFQNTESQAYNGVAGYFQSSTFLTLSQQMGRVESRHSAFISGLVQSGIFVDSNILNSSGYETGLSPRSVLSFYKPYIKTALDLSTLPNS